MVNRSPHLQKIKTGKRVGENISGNLTFMMRRDWNFANTCGEIFFLAYTLASSEEQFSLASVRFRHTFVQHAHVGYSCRLFRVQVDQRGGRGT